MQRVSTVSALPGWQLEVVFDDATRGIISLKDRFFGPVFEPLKHESLIAQARVDEFGAICWPSGADLAPDAIYQQLRSHTRVA